jgi:hypothetical protein
MECAAVLHLSLGVLILLGPIGLAAVILLTIEATLVRPADRADSLAKAGGRPAQEPVAADADWAPSPRPAFADFRTKSADGAKPSHRC